MGEGSSAKRKNENTREIYDRLGIFVPKGLKEYYSNEALEAGFDSLNSYVIWCMEEEIRFRKGKGYIQDEKNKYLEEPEDLTGKKFGKLKVNYPCQKQLGKYGNQRIIWNCTCEECGKRMNVSDVALKRGSFSCSCESGGIVRTQNMDITGERFGHLVALHKVENATRTTWRFQCDCGNQIEALITNVKSGKTQSCGRMCGLKKIRKYENDPS